MINYKKITAFAASALMVGLTMGTAVAASFPAPFVTNGAVNTAVVYGTGAGVDALDQSGATKIQTNLKTYVTSTGGATVVDTEGDLISLDTSATRIWLNTSLNTAKSTLTKADLPVVLADYTFSGDVDAKLTSTIKIGGGNTAGTDNSGMVIFTKQPKSSNDPVIGISLGSSNTYMLYNASVTMKAVNFTSSDSEGETINLFGKEFVVSTATDTSDLVLFSSAEEKTLSIGGSSPVPSATVNIGGTDYTITLVSGSDTTATIDVDGESKEVTEGNSKKISGLEVALKNVDESEAISTITATILVGSEKITFTNGASVTRGSDDDPIDGTTAFIKGGTTACTELAVTVIRPDSSEDAILEGGTFTDPVFESFKLEFVGLSSPLDDADREVISVQNSGDTSMSITMTDSEGNTGTFEFAHNATYASALANTPVKKPANWRLADDSNYSIFVHEGANITEDDYVVLGNEDYGHLLQVTKIYNNTGTSYTDDKLKLQDVISGDTFEAVFTAEGTGTVSIGGKAYGVTFLGSGDDGYATIKYPTSDSATTNTWVMYPTIETESGAKVALYEPLKVNLSQFNGTVATSATVLKFPDGDGYTSATFTYAGMGNWTVTGAGSGLLSANQSLGANYTLLTIGELTYNITSAGDTGVYDNTSMIYLTDPEGTANIDQPALIVFEGKDDNNEYHAVVVDLETAPAGTSSDGVGVNDVLFTQYGEYYLASSTLASDSDITKEVDWYGTLVTTDADDSDQKKITITLPENQVYAQVYMGEVASVINTDVTQLGVVLALDSDVSALSGKDLIVVGGSCINSVAARLLGSTTPICGPSFTQKTGIGAGQAIIKTYSNPYTSSKTALLVAGYEVTETSAAVDYLINKKPDTSSGLKVMSATEAITLTA